MRIQQTAMQFRAIPVISCLFSLGHLNCKRSLASKIGHSFRTASHFQDGRLIFAGVNIIHSSFLSNSNEWPKGQKKIDPLAKTKTHNRKCWLTLRCECAYTWKIVIKFRKRT
uniref:Uncharacterized protein n=1 Tax=Arundo donax TaxID=35708 RepID=A0A0A9CVW1_ARUDO